MDKKKKIKNEVCYRETFLTEASCHFQPNGSCLDTKMEKRHLNSRILVTGPESLFIFLGITKGQSPKTGKKTTWEGRRGKVEEI